MYSQSWNVVYLFKSCYS